MQHDRDIREPLFLWLEEKFGRIRILEEKTMGRSRADVVMVTEDGLCGIEIKSDADGYARLSRQVRDYDRYFDRNLLVAGTSHMAHAEEHLPAHWGILAAETLPDGRLDFYLARKPRANEGVSAERKLSLLWRRELNGLLSRNGLPAYAGESKKFVIAKLLERVPPERLRVQIAEELFERDYTTIGEEIDAWRAAHEKKPKRKKRPRGRRA